MHKQFDGLDNTIIVKKIHRLKNHVTATIFIFSFFHSQRIWKEKINKNDGGEFIHVISLTSTY